MEDQTLYGKKFTFKLPSGYEVTIREQNGEDDDILSNPVDARTFMNISKFISGIVTDTDITANRLLSAEDVQKMPSLDRYAIMLNSRIFSLGKILDFSYDWEGPAEGQVRTLDYEVDLQEEFLFDYGTIPTMEEMEAKPNAIPFYPVPKQSKGIQITTKSGKELCFDLLSAEGESYVMNLPAKERTKNQELVARNLQLNVGENYEPVKNFRLFSSQDMMDIRSAVKGTDPVFNGTTQIEDPETKQRIMVPVMAVDNLPCELPKDASEGFGIVFLEQVIPAFFNDDKDGVLARAKVTENGKLTERFAYLQDYVDGK